MRWLVAFGRFWWDFVVGDSVALAVGGVVALTVGEILVATGAGSAAQVVVPLAVVATLAASLRA